MGKIGIFLGKKISGFVFKIDSFHGRVIKLPSGEHGQIIEKIAVFGATPINDGGNFIVFDQKIKVEQVVVNNVSALRTKIDEI